MASGRPTDSDLDAHVERYVIVEVNGPNIFIRATRHVDRAYTTSLADVINAASETDTCVVIHPKPIRCDDGFSAYESTATDRPQHQWHPNQRCTSPPRTAPKPA